MKVSCFCGTDYEFEGSIGPCPKCDRIATDGTITEEEAQELLEGIVEDWIA